MLQLGTQTGSLINHLKSRAVIGQPEVFVGMGVTMLSWTDRSAGTITEIFSVGKKQLIKVCDDDAKRIDKNGMSESQEYEYTTNENNNYSHFTIGRKGAWEEVYKNKETGRWVKAQGKGLIIGKREQYHDFSF